MCAHVQGFRQYQDSEVQGPGGRVPAAEAPSMCVVPIMGFFNQGLGSWRFGSQCGLHTDLGLSLTEEINCNTFISPKTHLQGGGLAAP